MAPRHRDGPRPQPLYIATSNQFVRYKFNSTEPNPLGRIMFCVRGSVGVPMNILHSSRRDQVLIDARRIKFSYPQNEHIVFVAAWEEYKAKAWVRRVVLSPSRPQITHGEIATIYAELYWESLRVCSFQVMHKETIEGEFTIGDSSPLWQ
ncbi:hypothetical protein AMATHDRAFT_50390 [Amanita thiersii Skay4041]|uniref:Uncharacterized protein n=1 Tax=Amanita thiersii Skay4041 TaxID=703135 RepID=A0A2A9NDC6_9AGAR|nr:hypothetical protein AMATHDRAFT_50390 [Amanita thiersii Skay4041]